MTVTREQKRLSKDETVALWHAVESLKATTGAMRSIGCAIEQIKAEEARLKVAQRALRKVNELRKQGL